jgi:hypothetical protein
MHNTIIRPADDSFHLDSSDAELTIVKLAKIVQISADAIRYYEKEGLI